MNAWTNSLTQMVALVQGISQQAMNGETFLALLSWHLYPYLTVVTPSMAHVLQNDPAFWMGGILAIGLQSANPRGNGVHWSPPLAYLRHYGASVISARSISSGLRSRLSFQELLQATLGSLLQSKGAAAKDTSGARTWMPSMYHMITEARKRDSSLMDLTTSIVKHSGLALLSEAADHYIASTGLELQHTDKIILLVRKQARAFLGTPSEPLQNG